MRGVAHARNSGVAPSKKLATKSSRHVRVEPFPSGTLHLRNSEPTIAQCCEARTLATCSLHCRTKRRRADHEGMLRGEHRERVVVIFEHHRDGLVLVAGNGSNF